MSSLTPYLGPTLGVFLGCSEENLLDLINLLASSLMSTAQKLRGQGEGDDCRKSIWTDFRQEKLPDLDNAYEDQDMLIMKHVSSLIPQVTKRSFNVESGHGIIL